MHNVAEINLRLGDVPNSVVSIQIQLIIVVPVKPLYDRLIDDVLKVVNYFLKHFSWVFRHTDYLVKRLQSS